MSQIRDIQQRIMDIAADYVTASSSEALQVYAREDDCSFASSALPAFVVRRGRALDISSLSATHLVSVTREFFGRLYLKSIAGDTTKITVPAELDDVADEIDLILAHFAQVPRLERDGDAGIVDDARIVQDTGDVQMFAHAGKRYAGAAFRFRVTYRMYLGG